ncbi:MAG TPA: hypothetical protein VMT30_03985 [Candidatus Saccharimonadia bacterium]|nr:hypothetical protein [Candidatus Saccharimonadia bacterium]
MDDIVNEFLHGPVATQAGIAAMIIAALVVVSLMVKWLIAYNREDR